MAETAKHEPQGKDRLTRRAPALLVILLLLGLVARGLIAYNQAKGAAEAQPQKPSAHLTVADNILAKGQFVSDAGRRAEVMPGYPALVAGLMKLFDKKAVAEGLVPLALLQALISTLTIAAVYDIGRRISGSWAGLVAAALLTINPLHILLCGRASPETLFVFLFAFFIWSVVLFRGSFRFSYAILAGMLFAVSVYVSPSAILFAPVLLIVLAIGRQRNASFKGWLTAAVVFAVAISPWVIRNYRVLGEFVVTTTSVGENICAGLGVNADAGAKLARQIESQNPNEVQRDRAYRTAAWKEVVADPRGFLLRAWDKIKTMWNPAISTVEAEGKIYRILSYSAFFPTVLLAAVGLLATLRRNLWTAVLMILPAVYWTVLEAFRVGSAEHRIVAMPMIMVLGGAGLAWVFSRETPAEKKKEADV